jgi:hypothetical protein
MRLVGSTHWTDLRGPAACDLLTVTEVDAVRARLGPDPLRHDADPERAWTRISRSRAPLATLLMDQAVISGIGNIYRAELLFRHRLDPLRPGCKLREDQWAALWSDLVELMHDGVHRGRIDTVRPEHDPVATASTSGPAWRRGLCLSSGWCTVPGVRHGRRHRTARRAQPLLVPSLPAAAGSPIARASADCTASSQ